MHLDTISRLRHLTELSTARNLAARDLGDRLRTVRDEKHRLQDRRDHVNAARYDRTGTEAELARIDQRMADLDEVIADLSHRQNDAQAAWQASKTLEVRCREFAAEQGLPVPEVVTGDADSYDGARLSGGLGMIQQGSAS